MEILMMNSKFKIMVLSLVAIVAGSMTSFASDSNPLQDEHEKKFQTTLNTSRDSGLAQSDFGTIPDDVHHHFLSFVGFDALSNLSITCKYFNALLGDKFQGNVIVMGPVSSGKSTLSHLLAGGELKGVHPGYGWFPNANILVAVKNIPGIDIDKGTTKPCAIPDLTHKRIIWDCSGVNCFHKNTFEEAQALYNVLKNKKLRVIYVIHEGIIDREMINEINKVTEIFPDQNQLKKLFSLVISNSRDLCDLKEFLGSFINTNEGNRIHLTGRGRELLEHLSNNPNQMALFKCPVNEGPYTIGSDLQTVLDNRDYVVKPEITVPVESAVKAWPQRWSSQYGYNEQGEQSSLFY
jgi:ribosome biogenesis GTPase A